MANKTAREKVQERVAEYEKLLDLTYRSSSTEAKISSNLNMLEDLAFILAEEIDSLRS